MSWCIRCLTPLGLVATLCLLITATAHATHARPKGASPTRTPLVPAYAQCAAPNRTHGPPLAFGSCNPPVQTSAQATVGTPDAFGGAANSAGYVRLRGVVDPLCCEGNDILISIVLNDVRCVPTGASCGAANVSGPADYAGELRFSLPLRLTDHFNGTAPGGGTDTATVQDFPVEQSWSCVQSGSTSTGSTCSLFTSLQVLNPSSVEDGRRQVWELDAVRIYDGGTDGDGDTTPDNTVFLRPGIFIP